MDNMYLTSGPFRYLYQRSVEVNEKIVLGYFFAKHIYPTRVYGLSEIEMAEYINIYNSTKEEIKCSIDRMPDGGLKNKLNELYLMLPMLDAASYIINKDKQFWFFPSLQPFKRLRRSIQLKGLLDDITQCCERMIQYMENEEWLALAHKAAK